MARWKRQPISMTEWRTAAEWVWTGMADWRAAHPEATFSEIEAALDERLNQVRARVLADLAMALTAADLQAASAEERPRCERCGAVLQARGRSERGVVTQGGAEVRLRRSIRRRPAVRAPAAPAAAAPAATRRSRRDARDTDPKRQMWITPIVSASASASAR